MKGLVKISDLFDVQYGANLELVNLEQCDISHPDAIYFVSRTEKSNGVSAIVKKVPTITPNPGHTLSVASGGSVLSSFYQPKPYYSGRDLYVLIPKKEMSVVEMLFYAYSIQLNRYKYNYGRQANRTLRDILIPEEMPKNFVGAEQKVFKSIQTISLDVLSSLKNTKSKVKKAELTDEELVKKYESGKIDMGKKTKQMLQSNPTAIKSERQTKKKALASK